LASVNESHLRGNEMAKLSVTKTSSVSRESLNSSVKHDKLRLELASARIASRAWFNTIAEARRTDFAALFARQALEAYAGMVFPELRLSKPFQVPYGKLDHAGCALANTMGRDASGLSLVEGLHIITSLYPALMTDTDRSVRGAYYTPPSLTARLLDQATEYGTDWVSAKVLDPAAGAGAFLIQSALRMQKAIASAEPSFVLAQIVNRLRGFELDPYAAGLGQAALEIAMAEITVPAKRQLPQLIQVCDTLEEPAVGQYDLVVGNPPYGRVALTPNQRMQYSGSLYGHANLYGVFTDIAMRWTKPGGLISYLTPTSFLSGRYYSALRAILAKDAPPVAIDFVHARKGVFEDVLQETLLATYKKGASSQRAQIGYLHIESEREARVQKNGTIAIPQQTASPWLAPRTPEHSALIAHVETMETRLSDWGFSVSTGPLVWNRHKGQLRDKLQGQGIYPLIWAESITADGRFVYRAQKRQHSPYFKLEKGDAWLLIEEPCVLLQRTTSKEQTRRLIAAELPAQFIEQFGGVVVENHLNMIRQDTKTTIPTAVVAALFNSSVLDQVFRCMNGSVAVSAFELEALPLPHPRNLKVLAALVTKGASFAQIDTECWRLYGRRG
jgi:adenine-specific DNA-methyltransferase